MASFRSFSEIVSSMIERLGLTQPDLDTKPGTVSRDLFIDIQADQLSQLYSILLEVSEKQSLATTSGVDLDRLAANFGLSRNTGTSSSGIAVFVINSVDSDIQIPSGTIVNSKNGATFETVGSFTISPSERGRMASTANRIRKSLNLAGLNGAYAVEIPIQCLRSGTFGNVAPFQINTTNLTEAISVTNVVATFGGSNREPDSSFRARILSIFSGANIGTSSGYQNAVLSTGGVSDAIVVEPGNSLMLRDGTETVETNDNSFRIINSGTGGKVDIYILGRNIISNSESFIYSDISGTGDASDDRNDFIIGQFNSDPTRTSEERRQIAFKGGSLPMQPVVSISSVSGSKSGLLVERFVDAEGVVGGNYELKKDLNPETGGSPFGFDRLHFVSNTKKVDGEIISKVSSGALESLRYSDVESVGDIYQDIVITNERCSVSNFDNSFIKLNHSPIVRISNIVNKTTGEVYILDPEDSSNSGDINSSGLVKIEGRRLPLSTDVISADYTWRKIFNKYIDYSANKDKSDAIDWSSRVSIVGEESLVEIAEDASERSVKAKYEVNSVKSVYYAIKVSSKISMVPVNSENMIIGIELPSSSGAVVSVVSVTNSDGVEIYKTDKNDGYFKSRIIYLPTDSIGKLDDDVSITYNRIELYDIVNGDGSHSGNEITLPSADILEGEGVLDLVNDIAFSESKVYIDYTFSATDILSTMPLEGLPVSGSSSSNNLFNSNSIDISGIQPVLFRSSTPGQPSPVEGGGPCQMALEVSGSLRPGKVKVSGILCSEVTQSIPASSYMSGLKISLSDSIKSSLDIGSLPDDLFISDINEITLLNSDGIKKGKFDLLGGELRNNSYTFGKFSSNQSLSQGEFIIPQTQNNSRMTINSSDYLYVSFLVNRFGFNEAIFSEPDLVYTKDMFARIDTISIPSGFRVSGGGLVGSLSITPLSEPKPGEIYYANYSFLAPKEGERITIEYNINSSILEATRALESTRPITADVLVKEAERLEVDVLGELVVNNDFSSESTRIIEDATSAVVNILSSSKLGTIVDYSDVINAATSIEGVDSLNISRFSPSGEIGRRSFIKALDNQYITAGSIEINLVSREDFRIN